MLKRALYVDNRYVFSANQFPEEVVSRIDVLGVGISNEVLRKLLHTLNILERRHAWHFYLRLYEAPNLPQEQHFFNHVSKHHVLCLRDGECDTLLSPRKQDT